MKRSGSKYIACIIILLLFGCTATNTNTVRKNTQLPKSSLNKKNTRNTDTAAPLAGSTEQSEPRSSSAGDGFVVISENLSEERFETVSDEEVAPEDDTESSLDNEQALLDDALEYCQAAQELWTGGNPERAIESLDQAYELVLRIDTDKHPDMMQQKEDLRFTISKRVLEIYSSRFTTVNGNHKAIPLIMNEHVEREIRLFQGAERGFFIEGVRRSGMYRPAIVKALQEAGLPEELSWLPLIESWYKVTALSPARALGIWQFIPSTGYKFGLKRDTWVDERMDPEKSTAAAIAYMKELHQMFGDWTTVLAAYNCGEGNVLRVIRQQKINYLDNFWDLYQRLPNETARYVPRFLATLHIMKEPEKYGFNFDELYPPLAYETVTVAKQVQIKSVAEKLGIPADDLCQMNPELRRKVTPTTPYALKVPVGSGGLLLSSLETIPSGNISANDFDVDYVYHTVRKGETLSRIAAKYRTNVDSIVRANKISRKRTIHIGQKLKIPVRGGKSGEQLSYGDEKTSDNRYRAQKGETLWTIAKKFNTDTTSLKKLNHLTSSLLYEGQMLTVSE